MRTEYVPRVNQLDALQLDKDILRIIRDQLTKSLQNLSPGLLSRFTPELDLILRAALWNYSVRLNASTFGQRLLFITYDRDHLFMNYRVHLHFILNILTKYFKDNVTFRYTRNQSLQQFIAYAEHCISLLEIVNFFRFLKIGKQPSLVDYALGLDHISMHGNRRREIGYSHMTRELIWGGFMELLGYSLPLINYHFVRRKFRSVVRIAMGSYNTTAQSERLKPKLTINSKCEYCNERPTLPHHMGCKHIFCYYCLQGNLLADDKFECPGCGWNSDVVDAI